MWSECKKINKLNKKKKKKKNIESKGVRRTDRCAGGRRKRH